jgi:hypothetical protein
MHTQVELFTRVLEIKLTDMGSAFEVSKAHTALEQGNYETTKLRVNMRHSDTDLKQKKLLLTRLWTRNAQDAASSDCG